MCIAIGDNGLARQAAGIPSHHWGFALGEFGKLLLMAAEGMGRLGNLKMTGFQEDLSFQGVPVPYETSVYVI